VATPVQVSGLAAVTAIAGGQDHSLALKSNGTVWAWGKGQSGQLGDGNFYSTGNLGVATPVQVIGLTNVTAIAAGGIHSLALKADGTVWAWGDNQSGQLGNGIFFIGEAAPVQVIGLSKIVAIACAGSHNLALESLPDGVIWAWGSGANGEVGDGNFYPGSVATPVQVSFLTTVAIA
jgi:alpha-tubulin suppressor-like RCC1 family protein